MEIVIESEISGYLLSPEWRGEIRQRLTMRRNGSLAFTRYYIGPSGTGTRSVSRFRNKPTAKIMEYISWWFKEPHEYDLARDADFWLAELTNTDGEQWIFSSTLCDDLEVYGYKLSAITRKVLEMPELWMFDKSAEIEKQKLQGDYDENV